MSDVWRYFARTGSPVELSSRPAVAQLYYCQFPAIAQQLLIIFLYQIIVGISLVGVEVEVGVGVGVGIESRKVIVEVFLVLRFQYIVLLTITKSF